ncbi:unnamed protein product [Brachionus calyciflorus]|uniref:C-type lectin domain-containing protein n=1 Tax=Brachionus calyciflorus TaxID=104777 RepID=A0A813NEX9_9BILA|nr:unnamed protein product [Brachionus calyciflorus]
MNLSCTNLILLLKLLLSLSCSCSDIKSISTTTTTITKTTREKLIKNFCPKKHFAVSNTSCLMYYLSEKTYLTAESICNNYSDYLITLESRLLWNNLVKQLNEFKLNEYSFRIGLKFSDKLNKWYWPSFLNSYLNHNHVEWCKSKDTFSKPKVYCSNIKFDKFWCLEPSNCNYNHSFICEWRPDRFRTYNLKLGKILNYVFAIFSFLSFLCLVILSYFLVEFYKNSKVYMLRYYEEMDLHLSDSNKKELLYFKKLF